MPRLPCHAAVCPDADLYFWEPRDSVPTETCAFADPPWRTPRSVETPSRLGWGVAASPSAATSTRRPWNQGQGPRPLVPWSPVLHAAGRENGRKTLTGCGEMRVNPVSPVTLHSSIPHSWPSTVAAERFAAAPRGVKAPARPSRPWYDNRELLFEGYGRCPVAMPAAVTDHSTSYCPGFRQRQGGGGQRTSSLVSSPRRPRPENPILIGPALAGPSRATSGGA